MTQEDKKLLLKDLCARLPYGVKGIVYAEVTNGEYDINGDMIFFDTKFNVELDLINTSTEEIHVVAIGNEDTVSFMEEQQEDGSPYTIDEFKPYLRPMSSMTEEEKKKLEQTIAINPKSPYGTLEKGCDNLTTFCAYGSYLCVSYLYSRHFDVLGLIEKDLALKAPEGMYNIKK